MLRLLFLKLLFVIKSRSFPSSIVLSAHDNVVRRYIDFRQKFFLSPLDRAARNVQGVALDKWSDQERSGGFIIHLNPERV
jgi:hypothetical protein